MWGRARKWCGLLPPAPPPTPAVCLHAILAKRKPRPIAPTLNVLFSVIIFNDSPIPIQPPALPHPHSQPHPPP